MNQRSGIAMRIVIAATIRAGGAPALHASRRRHHSRANNTIAITMAIGLLIIVAMPRALAAAIRESRCSIQMPRVMYAVNDTSMRAVCAEPQTSSDVAQTNAASGPF